MIDSRVKNLTENTSDILESVRAVHGERYYKTLLFLFCTSANITQLDDMICESTALILNMAASQNDTKLVETATQKHEVGHSISEAATLGITGLIALLESELGMKDLHKNFASLLHRIEVDFRNPNHGPKASM